MWWILAREVLLMKGKMTRQTGFILEGKEIMPDLYFYRDPEEQEKKELIEPVEKEPWGSVPQVDTKLDEVWFCMFISGCHYLAYFFLAVIAQE